MVMMMRVMVVRSDSALQALRVTLPQPRAKHLAEIRIRKAAHLKVQSCLSSSCRVDASQEDASLS